jgi:uncharacterized protein YbaP (TraB family)
VAADDALDPAAELATAQRRHRRRMLVVAGAVALASAGGALAIATCSGSEDGLPPIDRPYLWKVTGTGVPPSYLLGTIHIGYGIEHLPRAVLDAQASAAVTVVETDLLAERPSRPAMDPAVARARLTSEQWKRLAELVERDRAELETWESSQLLGATMACLVRRVEAMDRALQRRATELGKRIVFLETRQLEEVMREDVILEGLREMLDRRKLARDEVEKVLLRYASGVDPGANPVTGPVAHLPSSLNDTWFAAIDGHVAAGGAFVAIGSAHLIGPGSVVERLRAKGLDVQRVAP